MVLFCGGGLNPTCFTLTIKLTLAIGLYWPFERVEG